jgi:DnaK suppressor protein
MAARTTTQPRRQTRGAGRPQDSRAADAARLERLKQRLREDLDKLREGAEERLEYGSDFESLVAAAQVATQRDIDELLRRRLERRLAELERITRRLEQEGYGRCEVCGVEIPAERLAAMPGTTLCVACQRERERHTGRRRAA